MSLLRLKHLSPSSSSHLIYICRRLLSSDSNLNQKINTTNQSHENTKSISNPLFSFDVRESVININSVSYPKDSWTNVNPRILNHMSKNLHLAPHHPISFIRKRIVDFIYRHFPRNNKSPLFSVFDNLSPIVSTFQNFDSLLIPIEHPSRKKSDGFYVNQGTVLRSHTSAHQFELIKAGLTNFLVVGDVYRRDEVNRSHYPVFHQLEGVRLCGHYELFKEDEKREVKKFSIFENSNDLKRTNEKQESHSRDAVYLMTIELKKTLITLAQELFGKDVETRWTETFFPFTHPSWELEVMFNGEWLEVLGCGIMEQKLINNAGAVDKIGWAFGLGLERLAMKLYSIPDIRIFWSTDSGILHQFQVNDPYAPITYKEVSQYPQCTNDISFWLPTQSGDGDKFNPNDFYDLVRTIGGNTVEQVSLIDEFYHKKKQSWSQTYRIVYRHMSRTLTQHEVNLIHHDIEKTAVKNLGVSIR